MKRRHVEDSVRLEVGHRLQIVRASDVGFQQDRPAGGHDPLKVLSSSEPEVIDNHHARAGIHHQVDQVRTDEARPASNQYAFH
jgi:hypothetical protein